MDVLDPVLAKAIRLLHSTSPTATDELHAMLEEVIQQKRQQQQLSVRPSVIEKASVVSISRPTAPSPGPSVGGEKSVPILTIPDKRLPPKPGKQESSELGIPLEKRVKLDQSAKSRSLTSSPDPSSKPIVLPTKGSPRDSPITVHQQLEVKTVNKSVEDDSETTDIEENDKEEEPKKEKPSTQEATTFNIEEDFFDLACVVCKSIEHRPGNVLVECQECHSLYHQECHKPPATSQEISDPRTIWYCSKCSKTMKKNSNKSKGSTTTAGKATTGTTSSAAFQAAINMGKESAMALVKERQVKEAISSKLQDAMTPVPLPFNRRTVTGSASGEGKGLSAATNKPTGLAGLASLKSSGTSAAGPSASTTSTAVEKKLPAGKKKAIETVMSKSPSLKSSNSGKSGSTDKKKSSK